MAAWTAEQRELARRDWQSAPAGPEIDGAIRQLVADIPYAGSPSRDIRVALRLIEWMTVPKAPYDHSDLRYSWHRATGRFAWTCTLYGEAGDVWRESWECEASAPTPALAICRAFLQFKDDGDA